MDTPQQDHSRPAPEHDAPTYRECPVCGHLSAKAAFISGQANCPECGSPGDGRRPFPAERIRRVDARIRRYHGDGEHEVVVILVATFLETLLEDMLARIMAAEGATVKLRVAGDASTAPPALLARTANVCAPELSGAVVYVPDCAVPQAAQTPPSSWQSKPAVPVPGRGPWRH